jgi:predicted signal transduction protein with EAL and GGDEF domain
MEVTITVSLGVSQWRSSQEVGDLLHQADLALYRAKQNGRNRVEVENAGEADVAYAEVALGEKGEPVSVRKDS